MNQEHITAPEPEDLLHYVSTTNAGNNWHHDTLRGEKGHWSKAVPSFLTHLLAEWYGVSREMIHLVLFAVHKGGLGFVARTIVQQTYMHPETTSEFYALPGWIADYYEFLRRDPIPEPVRSLDAVAHVRRFCELYRAR